MNCCDANGQCKGGHGCPVGDMPVKMVGPEPADDMEAPWSDLFWIVVAILVIFAVGVITGRATA